jgi:hypothetical protein
MVPPPTIAALLPTSTFARRTECKETERGSTRAAVDLRVWKVLVPQVFCPVIDECFHWADSG